MAFGLGYGVVMVGVPGQDLDPAASAREAFHVRVSSACLLSGLAVLGAGVTAFLVRFAVRRARLPGVR